MLRAFIINNIHPRFWRIIAQYFLNSRAFAPRFECGPGCRHIDTLWGFCLAPYVLQVIGQDSWLTISQEFKCRQVAIFREKKQPDSFLVIIVNTTGEKVMLYSPVHGKRIFISFGEVRELIVKRHVDPTGDSFGAAFQSAVLEPFQLCN